MTPREFARRMAELAASGERGRAAALALLLEALCAQGYGEGCRLFESAFGVAPGGAHSRDAPGGAHSRDARELEGAQP